MKTEKQTFSLVEIRSETDILEICRFSTELKKDQVVYMSYPYVLIFDDNCARFYIAEGKRKTKNLKHINTFYENQMKVGNPQYFSPDFMHRIYIDNESKEIKLNYTLNNSDLLKIDLMGSLNFKENYICWKEIDHKLVAFKSPNVLMTWDLDTGKAEERNYMKGFFLDHHKLHTTWDGKSLLIHKQDAYQSKKLEVQQEEEEEEGGAVLNIDPEEAKRKLEEK